MAGSASAEQITKAISAHGQWKLRLRTAITRGQSDFTVADVRCDDQCEFGKWLYDPSLDVATRRGMPYIVVRRLHAEFHECAADVLDQALSGKRDQAEAAYETDYTPRSEKLVRALAKWRREFEDAPQH